MENLINNLILQYYNMVNYKYFEKCVMCNVEKMCSRISGNIFMCVPCIKEYVSERSRRIGNRLLSELRQTKNGKDNSGQ